MLISSDSKPSQSIYPTKGTQGHKGRSRAGARSSYLGYSAGKATYGRYFTKNTIENDQKADTGASYRNCDDLILTVCTVTVNSYTIGYILTRQDFIFCYNEFITSHSLNPIETLDDICLRSQWGKPQYQLIQSTNDGKTPAYLYRITILPLGVTIQSPKVSNNA